MNKKVQANKGLRKIIKAYQDAFRIPENLNFYSKGDYQSAEKKFVKLAILHGNLVSLDIDNHIIHGKD